MKKTLSLILCIVFITTLLVLSASAAEIVESGSYLKMRWSLDDEGTLKIEGPITATPWKPSMNKIKKIVIVAAHDVPEFTFAGYTAVESVELQHQTTIHANAFVNCTSLKTVKMQNVITIKEEAFAGCTSLKKVELSKDIFTVESGAFKDCVSLDEIILPEKSKPNLKYIENLAPDAFANTALYNDEDNWEDGILYLENQLLAVKSNIKTANIKEGAVIMVRGAFANCTELESVTFSSTVIRVSEDAFNGCTKLKNIVFHDNDVKLESHAFANCPSLEDVYLPQKIAMSEYEYRIFYNCPNINLICYEGSSAHKYAMACSIPYTTYTYHGSCGENLTWEINIDSELIISGTGDMSFAENPWREYEDKFIYVILSEGVESICDSAFKDCSGIYSVKLPSTLKKIGDSAFEGCTKFNIQKFSNMEKIGERAFYGCTSIIEVQITNVSEIGARAFAGCTKLETFSTDFNAPITIGEYAFDGCTKLAGIYLRSNSATIKPFALFGSAYYNNANKWIDGALYLGEYLIKVEDTATSISVLSSTKYVAEGAFSGCTLLEQVNLPEGITAIDEKMFSSCVALKKITIPPSVISIAPNAFSACENVVIYAHKDSYACQYAEENDISCIKYVYSGTCGEKATWVLDEAGTLIIMGSGKMQRFAYYNAVPWKEQISLIKKVVVETGITDISQYAFINCTALESVTIPDTVTDIYAYAFRECSALKSVSIPDTVTGFGTSIFYNCAALENATLPVGRKSIPGYMFYGCKSLKSITIPDGVTTIGSYAFYGCEALEKVKIPEKVQTLYDYAFYNCTALKEINIPQSVTEMGSNVFGNCTALTSITIPESVTYVGTKAFENCTTLKEINCLFKGTTLKADIFSGCVSLEEINIPSSVTLIENNVFKGCTALKKVVVPKSVKRVCEGAFAECTAIDEVHIEDLTAWYNIVFDSADANPLHFGAKLYLNGELVTELVFPDNVYRDMKYQFNGCTSITSVVFPKNYNTIGDGAFENCTSLDSVTISEGVIHIGARAFAGCTALSALNIPESVKTFGADPFVNSAIYDNPDNWEGSFMYIGKYLAAAKTDITTANIKEGTRYIGISAFENCKELTEIIIPESVISIGTRAFFGCTALEDIKLNYGLNFIGEEAFAECTSLGAITIPQTVRELHKNTFLGCVSLEKAVISSYNTKITEEGVFDGCEKLVIFCYNATSAHNYAIRQKIPFTIMGAANGGGGGGSSKPKKPVVGLTNFKTVKTYDKTFTDVESDAWYAGSIKIAYELDLVNGKGGDKYDPAGNMTIAEAITLVARIHSIYKTGKGFFDPWIPWYEVYVDYAIVNDIIAEDRFTDFNAPVTREEFAEIFAKAIPEDDLNAINNIEKGSIPDVAESDAVYLLYNAGILTGSDEAHSFKPESNIQRSEVATIVTRIVDKEKRVTFEIK